MTEHKFKVLVKTELVADNMLCIVKRRNGLKSSTMLEVHSGRITQHVLTKHSANEYSKLLTEVETEHNKIGVSEQLTRIEDLIGKTITDTRMLGRETEYV